MIKAESPVEVNEKFSLVERVAASETFRKSPRLRDFLIYSAGCTLEKRLEDAREQVIAEHVFGRRADFNGGQDSIVRAEARNLRKRLEVYFETEGKNEPVVLVMPKGSYTLSFENRPVTAVVADLAASPTVNLPPLAPFYPREVFSQVAQLRKLCGLLILLGTIAAGLALYWHSADSELRRMLRLQEPVLPFSALLKNGKDTVIVTSDTGLLQISSLVHRRISLDEYMARTYPAVPATNPPNLIQNWNLYEFTDGREMAIASLMVSAYAQYAPRIAIRSGHQVQLQDFKDHNIILIGSPISNPWAQLYEDKLDFPTDLLPDGRIVFVNKSPSAHESRQYPDQDDIDHHRTYSRVVFLPATSGSPPILMIAGTTAQATEVAGELFLDPNRVKATFHSVGMDPEGTPRFFELLIRTNNFVGGALLPELVAWRTGNAPN